MSKRIALVGTAGPAFGGYGALSYVTFADTTHSASGPSLAFAPRTDALDMAFEAAAATIERDGDFHGVDFTLTGEDRRAPELSSPCDYCSRPVEFRRVEIGPGPFTALEPVTLGSGSDHLATWCAACGPLHREARS